jgi:cell division protease FtsH
MVSEFGMSELVGPVHLTRQRSSLLLDPRESTPLDGGGGRVYSEATATAVDEEVKRILDEAHERAHRILDQDRTVLDELAERLLEKEVVDRSELRELMGKPPLPEGEEGGAPRREAAD